MKSAASLRIVMAQLNLLVGDVVGNTRRVIECCHRARDKMDAQAIVFPELTLTGYPPEDLLLRPVLYTRVREGLEHIRKEVTGIHVIVGHPYQVRDDLFNAATVLRDGEILGRYRKQHLPNYSVFDEKRYFAPGKSATIVEIGGVSIGVTICEDLWMLGPVQQAVDSGAQLIVNLNASPFHVGKGGEREDVARDRIKESGVPVLYVNLVGGQDQLVFDGGSFAMDGSGSLVQRAPSCIEDLVPVDILPGKTLQFQPGKLAEQPGELEAIYNVLVLGVKDYIEKNGFPGAVIGLSGGIDSALTLTIAVDAIGRQRVAAVMMPSRYTADMSLEDARQQAKSLGVEYSELSIEPAVGAFRDILADTFSGLSADVTEENIQARCRGVILMAISNKKHKILLTTGNKSELAVGYATLYGDMAGGFAPLKDVPKTLVYRLAEYRNRFEVVIPRRVLERPPTAELAPDQKDEDSLPPYHTLDAILERYVELDQSIDEVIKAGFDEAVVQQVTAMVDRNEYKRSQAPPGVRITRRAFGRDRRYPITSGFNKSR
ncbi:MAG: NAD+ synthase [Gammaproteobacteria bacterium]